MLLDAADPPSIPSKGVDPGPEERFPLLSRLHSFAHDGVSHLVTRASKLGFYWNTMHKDAKLLVGSCSACLISGYSKRSYTSSLSVSSFGPMDVIQIDLMKFQAVADHYSCALCVVDVFSSFIWLIPLVDGKFASIWEAIESIFYYFGFPRIIQCDNGTEFLPLSDAAAAYHSIKVVYSSPYNSRSNGRVERAIQSAKSLIYKLCYESNQDSLQVRAKSWPKVLPQAMFGLNTRIHPSSKLSPFQVMFNRLSNGMVFENASFVNPDASKDVLLSSLHHILTLISIRDYKDAYYSRQSSMRDSSVRCVKPLPIGSIVFFHVPKGLKYNPFEGPFHVTGHDKRFNHIISDIVFGVQPLHPLFAHAHLINSNMLLTYH